MCHIVRIKLTAVAMVYFKYNSYKFTKMRDIVQIITEIIDRMTFIKSATHIIIEFCDNLHLH